MNTLRFFTACIMLFNSPIMATSDYNSTEEYAICYAEDYILGNITTGPEAIYDYSQSQAMAISDLDDTKFVICYSDGGSSGAGKCMVGTRTNTSVTFGPGYSFTSNNIYNIKVVNLSSTQFVFAFRNNNGYSKVRLGTVSGNSISFSSSASVTNTYVDNFGLTALSSTKFAVAYKNGNNSGRGALRVGLVNGGGLSLGANQSFNSNQTNHISIDALDANTLVVSYKDDSNSNKGTSIIGSVSGTSVSFSPERVFNSGNTEWINTIALSANKFVVVYSDLGNGNSGTACVGTVSGNTITFSNEYVFNSGTTTTVVATGHGANNFSVSYSDGANGNNLNANAGTISGSAISFDTEVILNGNVQVPATSAVGLDFFVTIYKDDPNGGRSTAIAAQISGILPVELLDFSADRGEQGIQLNWTTASEENNEGFEIQRSPDGLSWKSIEFIRGMGTSFVTNNYLFTDEQPISGVNYYRLKQMDYDGLFSFSKVNSVVWSVKDVYKIFPNPAGDQVWIKTDKTFFPEIRIYDTRGRLVDRYPAGTEYIDLSDMEKGIYYLEIKDVNRVEQHTLVRQ